jgi:CHAT domain-containing protein
LPGHGKGRVLLEEYALALIPNGPFLLDQLRHELPPMTTDTLVVVGGVAYDRQPAASPVAAELRFVRSADVGERMLRWDALPGTAAEVEQILELVRQRRPLPAVLDRQGSAASSRQLLVDLPVARWVHLATHGFFAAPKSEVRRALLDDRLFSLGVGLERRGAGARNPLVQTGLVLAGANVAAGKDLDDDRGLLTAEAIAGLPLGKLELAVLSACETGLGEAQAGQGVFGLQRAFHLAGARNVVASLWKVDDQATAALMKLFYHNLWLKGQKPLDALRNAQLAMLHSPEAVSELARTRGNPFAKVVKRVEDQAADPKKQAPPKPAPVKQWAAFVFSGAGR